MEAATATTLETEHVSIARARLLFVPVSGPTGTGEYYRCLNIARAIHRRRPELEVHFLLNRDAEVERDSRFDYHLLEATPSRAVATVTGHIERIRPDVAVFDCTGRKRHYRAVKAVGGRLIWISNRPHKRRRGFHPLVLRTIDLHLIGESGNPKPALSAPERWMLKLFGPARIAFFSAVAPEAAGDAAARRSDLPAEYAVFASGGGGYEHRGQPVPELFLDAARRFRQRTGMEAVVVMGPQYRGAANRDDDVRVIPSMPTDEFGGLLAGARLAVIGAGYMISSHALAAGLPFVLAAVGGRDQPARVRRYSALKIALGSELDPVALSDQAARLLEDSRLARALVERAREAGIRNDVGRLAERILELLDQSGRAD